MIKRIALATAALTLLAAPAAQADDHAEMTRGEAKLAKLLEGRVAGEPQSCIRTIGSRNLNQIDGTALTYKDGDTIWVNYTRNPESIDDFDVMVIDRMLPRLDGLSLVKSIRIADVPTPIIILSAMGGLNDRVEGLEAGADDYLVKPFAFSELHARISALMRRIAAAEGNPWYATSEGHA